MPATYGASNVLGGFTNDNISTAYKTQLSLTAQTTGLRSAAVTDIEVGSEGTPSDSTITWDVSRQTAAGTGGDTITPVPYHPSMPACATVAAGNFTGEPTVTAATQIWTIALNVRASFRWVAAPGDELIIPATNLAGFAFRAKSPAYALPVIAYAAFRE